jgi:monoamine oxidase
MAFKMKGPSLYQNGALGKNLKVQKDYSGKEDGRATSSPLQMSIAEPVYKPPMKIPANVDTSSMSPVQQTEPTRRSELKSLRKATKAVKSNQRKTKRTKVKAGRQISRDIDKDLGKEFRNEARDKYKTDKKNFKVEAKKKKQEVKDKWKNK